MAPGRGRMRGDHELKGSGALHSASCSPSRGTVVAWRTAYWPSRMRQTPMLSNGITLRTAVATRSKTSWSSMVSEAVSAISARTSASETWSTTAGRRASGSTQRAHPFSLYPDAAAI